MNTNIFFQFSNGKPRINTENYMGIQIFFSVMMFFSVALALNIGFYFGHKKYSKLDTKIKTNTAAVNGPLLALLGLLLAFTFNGATNRFDDRRALVVEESIAINSLYRKIDFLPIDTQDSVREKLREYVVSRIQVYEKIPNIEEAYQELYQSRVIKEELRKLVNEALFITNNKIVYSIILPVLAKMYEIEERRYAIIHTHPPLSIFFLLFGLATIVSFLAGYEMSDTSDKPMLHGLVFAFVISTTTYLTLDIEFPRLGFIIADGQDYLLYETLEAIQ